ncbi:MAG TPA: serine/threonine-protein kinase [Methylomirabilota bacterium]|jgi:serine/threonine protein kinase|nr:serine/threonine-protein kinase [Methylomirabilota bacterium]
MITPQGRYEFLETLGTGATSRVDKARDTLIGRTVALKTFLHGFGSGDVQKQFLREAQIIGRLAHPYIVGLYDVGTNAEGVPYFVMEYVDGRTLEKVLDDGPLPLEKAALWATDLAAAIARAHRAKVIHGDIKPANILITREGQVKLGDFGIARFATQVSNSGMLMGTPAYLSPEQIQGNAQDTRSDLFSLGIILYQMTTGVQPFSGSSVSAVCAQIVAIMPPPPSHHNPSLPAAFDRIVMRCLAKDPADRYATAEALGASLYPFAHAQEMAPVVPEKPSAAAEFVGRAEKWISTAKKALKAEAQEQSRRVSSLITAIWTSDAAWWNRPMQRKDLWAAGTAAVLLVGLVPMARALRNRGHIQPVVSAAIVSGAGSSLAVSNTSSQAPVNSNASMINISSSTVGDTAVASSDAVVDEVAKSAVNFQDEKPKTAVMGDQGFERHGATGTKAHQLSRQAAAKSAAALDNLPVYGPGMPAILTVAETAPVKAAVAHATLRINIVSEVTEQTTLAVFSGDELLLTTPLKPEQVGDTLRFNCPIVAGEHALRVVLYRPDKTVFMHKENKSELHTDGANTMEVHVNRKSKMLVKHETLLEVVWPSTTTSSPAEANQGFKPAGALALR